jgi:hypothetical protein
MIHLPNPLTKSAHSSSHLFFAIILSEQYASAALWGVVDGQLAIIQRSEDHAWQEDESCINAIDQSLQELGKESENVSQTLFALPSDWVDADGIVALKKPLFQKMTKELSLEPIGFVVTTEAMTQYLTQSSPQLNIFVVEVGVSYVTVALVKAGQITQTIKVGRSGESVSDLREALAHLKDKSLPAKIELYSPSLSQEELNEVQQQLIGFEWKESYPFLHPPVIEVFDALSFADVVIKTGGAALVTTKGLLSADAKPPLVSDAPMKQTGNTPPLGDEPSNVTTVTADEMGFATSSLKGPVPHQETGETKEEKAVPQPELAIETPAHSASPVQVKKMPVVDEEPPTHHAPAKHSGKGVKAFFQAHLVYILAGVIGGVVLLSIFTIVAAQTMLQSKVLLTLKDQNITKDIVLTLDPQVVQSDPDRLLLKATVVNQTVEGEKTANTTGNKIIGDKAKGTVTLYNYTSSQKTFVAGTKVTSGKFIFLLDSDATVASASSSLDSSNNMLTKPGSQDAAATASAIGEDANIAAGTSLTIESFAKETYSAITKTAFSGGSSREIQAVSIQDRDQVLAALKKELVDKAVQDAKTASSNGQYEVPTNRVKVITSTYSAEVGKETSSLTLNLTLQVEMLQYSSADLQPLAKELLTKELPANYQLSDAPPQILSAPISAATTSAQVKLETNISTMAEPQISFDDLKQQIAGKSDQAAERILEENPAISSAVIEFSPKILGMLFHTLPSQLSRIVIARQE